MIYYTHNYKLIIILNFNYTQFLRKNNLKHIYMHKVLEELMHWYHKIKAQDFNQSTENNNNLEHKAKWMAF